MRELLYNLYEERKNLSKIRKQILQNNTILPEGKINVHKLKGKYDQYYIVEGNDAKSSTDRKYIKKSELEKVRGIAQRTYNEEVLQIVEERLSGIEFLLSNYENNRIEDVHGCMCDARRKLILPIIQTDAEFIDKWQRSINTGENTYPKTSNIVTEKGEQVRSKTEKILADKLLRNGIPYVYEPKIVLNDGRCLFPDFAMLNVRLRKTFYHEHFGMMDNPEYSSQTVEKIEEYQRNGFWSGKNMLFSFETSNRMPDNNNLDRMIRTFLK